MLMSEFETHTDIYPDAVLYDAIQREYAAGDWSSQAQFCHDFKFNEDGLAKKIQSAANERLTEVYEREAVYKTRICKLEDANKIMTARLSEAEDENTLLKADLATTNRTMRSMQQDDLKIRMLDALMEAANGEATADMILHMVFGFEYLLDAKEGEA